MSLLAATTSGGADLSAFGHEPWWLVLLKTVVIFVFLMLTTIMMIWAERRIIGRMQQRDGPNRVGPFGMVQGLADGVKLMLKEELIPAIVDKPVAVLFILAMAAVGVYGIVLAGWSSQSPYPLLGALRSAAQVISYEVAMGLALAAVFLYAGSLSTSEIVSAQHSLWYVIPLFPSFVMYIVSMVGETNRAPFDLPEAESELVAGFHTEYSSIKFAMFFLAEYVNMTTVCALATTLFLGGWRCPWPLSLIDNGVLNTGWWPVLWFLGKVFALLFFYIWLRGTLPRLRYDQFMKLGWKVLIPASLVWIMIVAAFRQLTNSGHSRFQTIAYVGIPLALIVLAISFITDNKQVQEAQETMPTADGLTPTRSRHPVPVLTGASTVHDNPAPVEEVTSERS